MFYFFGGHFVIDVGNEFFDFEVREERLDVFFELVIDFFGFFGLGHGEVVEGVDAEVGLEEGDS